MLSTLARLHAQCFPHKPWSETDFADLKKSGCDIIASQNGFIVYRVVADEAEIISIGVAPAARRGGIAAAMMGLAEQDAARRGATKMFLEVGADNIAALALYTAGGYTAVGRRAKYYDGVDAIVMGKKLA